MRFALALALAGCSGADDHRLHGSHDATTIRYTGHGVPFASIKGDWYGLPLSGSVDVTIDVELARGHDYRTANGTLDLACEHCTIGDDQAHLMPHDQALRDLAPDGFEFGHVTFDRIAARIDVGKSHLALVRFAADSPDLAIELALELALARDFDDSELSGCLRYRTTDALRARSPKTADLFALSGAPLDEDHFFTIKLAGTVGEPKLLAQTCTTHVPR